MAIARSQPSSVALRLIAAILAIAALHYARDVLVPVALALLLTFLLTPLVVRLQSWRFPRVAAVFLVMVFTVGIVGSLTYLVTVQLIEVANDLPQYKSNIHSKIQALQGPSSGPLAEASKSLKDIGKELTDAPTGPGDAPVNSRAAQLSTRQGHPVQVQVIEPAANGLQYLREVLGPVLSPLGTAAIVLVFAIFMLIDREQLRNRVLRLAGQQQLNIMTQALDDAAQRVSRYLLMQFLVNSIFGALLGGGLHLIGLPNAFLWGVIGGTLRFVPYAGTLIAGALPVALSLAVFNGWVQPMETFALFLVLELTVSNVVEPWLYGAHTGVSSLAILLAAIFWAALWGPVGLILSMPLTVCLVVLGRHIPQLDMLHVLLGDEPVLPPEARLYQRLLAKDEQEARAVAELYLKDSSLTKLYDGVLIPALSLAETDRHDGALEESRGHFLIQSMYELIAELGEHGGLAGQSAAETAEENALPAPVTSPPARVVCLPARDEADEICAAMLAQLLEQSGAVAIAFPMSASTSELIESAGTMPADVMVVSALPPFAFAHAKTVCRRLRVRYPKAKIILGLWNDAAPASKLATRTEAAQCDQVVTRLAAAVQAVNGPADEEAQSEKLDSAASSLA